MLTQNGLIHAILFDGKGHGRQLSIDELDVENQGEGFLWLHFDYTNESAQDWIIQHSGLHSADAEALLKDETRPRSVVSHDGLLLVLRGVNLNPGANPEDMVAVRLWADNRRIISTRYRRHMWEADVIELTKDGRGPVSTGEFISLVSELMVGRIHEVVQDIEDQVGELEENLLEQRQEVVRGQLADLRRQVINLRRYLAPQRDALFRLQSDKIAWLSDAERLHIRETHDRMNRAVEDLDAAHARASIANEELASRMSEQLNQRMYMLSMVAALFMPLTFLTGLLGINVGGIPGAENKQAFLWVCYILGALGLALYFVFRKRKWM